MYQTCQVFLLGARNIQLFQQYPKTQTWQVFLFQKKTVGALNLPGFPVGSKKYTTVSTRPEDANLAGFSVPNENRVCAKPARFFCWEQ
ncbi:hypothetical protein LZF95_26730, partial [Algoriphagus sp. AGSA1]|uniref:hypothetical protein n=1 Tax=Algoriphagus sp. AGSA1 TaxID=2907213 RepID=UPI001F2A7FD0